MEEKEFEITIKEVLCRTVKRKAPSMEAALDGVKAEYRAEKIVLEASDFSYSDFSGREVIPMKCKGR